MSAFRPYLAAAMSGRALSADEMGAAMAEILAGGASDIELAGFLAALRARGETVDEIAAAARAMRSKALMVDAPADAIDTCGTGGDGADTFNISTAAALIVAGAGVPVAKHGNKAASSKSGSSEVLEALGVRLDIPPAIISRCINEAKIGFMFAALHHGAVKHAAAARKGLGQRTMFNVLGPLSNPAGAKRQVLGVFARDLVRPIADVLPKLGVTAAWVVHGSDGLDELTTTGPTFVAALKDGVVSEFEASPADAGLPTANADQLKGGDPRENAEAIRRLLDGEAGAYRDIAVINAGAALVVADKADTLAEGAQLAERAIDTGAAKQALARLIAISNSTS
jgi:anthranilate phosphoribosyltransferase